MTCNWSNITFLDNPTLCTQNTNQNYFSALTSTDIFRKVNKYFKFTSQVYPADTKDTVHCKDVQYLP